VEVFCFVCLPLFFFFVRTYSIADELFFLFLFILQREKLW
jgi:hypothetical protein